MQGNRYFHDWIEQQAQQNKMLFAIVDPHSEWVPHRVFAQCDGQNGGPLLSSKQLTNAEDGPWLLPVNNEYLQWWSECNHAQSGILIATHIPGEVRAHFASVFQAVLLGERVFFPFYRPDYLGETLSRLDSEEINILLAGHSILLKNENGWKSYHSDVNKTQPVRDAPWWVIKEHHVDNAPNLPLLAGNVESWLWQHQSVLMLAHIESSHVGFQTQFQQSFLALDDSQPLMARTVIAAITAVSGEAALSQPDIKDAIDKTQDDELLFALQYTFTQLQGNA